MTIQNSEKTEKQSDIFNSQNSTAQIFVFFENSDNGNLNVAKSNVHNFYLESILADKIVEEFKFKSVILQPTQYQRLTDPEKYKVDYSININIKEKTIKPEPIWGMVLRAISFGFYHQKIGKSMIYKIEIINLSNNKKMVSSDSIIDSTYEYLAPFLILPLNLDSHPFSYQKQMALQEKAIINLMKQVIK